MRSALRLLAIFAIFITASVAWLVLGASWARDPAPRAASSARRWPTSGASPEAQAGPALTFSWEAPRETDRTETTNGVERHIREHAMVQQSQDVSVASTRVDVDLHLDQRLKGLMWYSLYDVGFRGRWQYVHTLPDKGTLHVLFRFPDRQGVYDAFSFVVDGKPQDRARRTASPRPRSPSPPASASSSRSPTRAAASTSGATSPTRACPA